MDIDFRNDEEWSNVDILMEEIKEACQNSCPASHFPINVKVKEIK